MKKRCLNIDRQLLPVKLHYFLFMAALACALPFRTVFAKQLGISATAVGVIFCAVPFMRIFTNPLFGFILDYFKRFRLILSISMIFVVLSHTAMVFIPSKSLTPLDKINSTENDFHSKLTYMWTNDSSHSSCNSKLTFNVEYILSQSLMGDSKNFICDMQCSKSKNNIPLQNLRDKSKCYMEMQSEFKAFVQVSDCDINVRLEEGQLAVFDAGIQNLLLFEVSNTLSRKIRTSVPSYENCSLDETNLMTFNPKSARNKEVKVKFPKRSPSKDVNGIEIFEFSMKNINNDDREKLIDGDITKYCVQKEYTINFSSKKLCLNSRCSQEFVCQANKCSPEPVRIEENLEQFEENEFLSTQFWSFFLLMIVSSVTFSAIIFMMDAACYELLQDRKNEYGKQRLWGTIGWGLGALIGGCLNQLVSSDSGEINYAPSFYLLAALALIDLIPLYNLKVTDLKYSSQICKDVCILFSKVDIVYNIFIVYAVGVLSGFTWNYQFWFMEEIGSSQVLLGLSQTFVCMFEVPCFFVSGWIIKKIGHNHCNSVTLLCFGLRYLCFSVMYNPWWTLPIGLIDAPTFGLFYASMTMYGKNEAPAGTEATVQSLLSLCFEGIGAATGSLLGGVGLDRCGSRMSFTYAAEISFILLFVNIVASFYFSNAKKYKEKLKCPP